MIENSLERIAERILALDEASLAGLWEKYKTRMENFDATREWEKAVIAFFIINAVRVKNQIFNERILRKQAGEASENKPQKVRKSNPNLKLVK
jgi:hypothetical protein